MHKCFIELCVQPIPMESFIAFMAIMVAVSTSAILWKYKRSAEVIYLIFIEILAAIWAFTSGMEFLADTLEMKKFWSQLSYFGIAFLPVCYFLFSVAFSQKFQFLKPLVITLLSIIPFLTIPIALTNEYHHLLWKNVTLSGNELNTTTIQHGVWFWVFWSYSIMLVIVGLYNLVLSIHEFSSYYKSQVSTLLVATLIPFIGNLMYITNLNPIPGMDWTPFMFAFSGLVITFGIVKYRMFDLVPFARNNLIDTMTDGVIIVNSEGFIEDYNPAINTIFGISKSVRRRNFTKVFSDYKPIIDAIKKEESTIVEITGNQNEKDKTYQVQVKPIYNSTRQFSGHLIQLNDITSLKHTENKLKQVNKKLEAEVEERGRLIEDLDAFAHTVAHDLKNSLGSINHVAEIIEECLIDGNFELLNEFSGHIKESAQKAMHITHELLLLATVTHHEVENKPLQMQRIFKNARYQLKELIYESNAKISYPDEWPDAVGYAPWIEEIWVNYLSNALKYGGTPPEIEVGAENGDHYVRFWIQDNGNGILPEDQGRLFKKYSRLAPEIAEGYGLGLSIVKRISRKLGGFVGVISSGKPGEGACFWFDLPTAKKNQRKISASKN